MNNLSLKLTRAINDELNHKERLIWQDQPIAHKRALPNLVMWLFFIPWTVALIPAVYDAIKQGTLDNVIHLIFLAPFLLIGISGLAIPFTQWLEAKNTVYVITDKRIFTLKYMRNIKVESFLPGTISRIKKSQNNKGVGSLVIQKEGYTDSEGAKQVNEYGFFAIKNVNRVEQLIQDLYTEKTRTRKTLL